MNTGATAYVTLPGNKIGADPGVIVIDDDGNQATLWDFGAWDPEEQNLTGAEELLVDADWRPASDGFRSSAWQPSGGQWAMRVEAI